MADNTQLNTGTGGDVISTDDLGSVKVQRVKVQYGTDGSATDVSGTNPLPVAEGGAATSAVTSVNDSATSVTLLASNASRLGASIFNDSTSILYVKLGTTASAIDYSARLEPQGYYEAPAKYTGRIDGIWSSDSTGAAKVTELTA